MKNNIHRQRNKDFWATKGSIPLWLIAERLSVHEQTLARWLRTEVETTKMQQIINIINEIKQEV